MTWSVIAEPERRAIRQQMRARRRALSPRAQKQAAYALSRHLLRQPHLHGTVRVALYLAADGEIDTRVLMTRLAALGKQLFLPVLRPNGSLWFRRYPARRMHRNRFGILEPIGTNVQPRQLDLVCMPLVAFDRRGGRLGMGGGFYDRSFAFLLKRMRIRPRLVGLAHHFQEVGRLPLAEWDVPLDAVVTDREWIGTRSRRSRR